MIVTYFVVGLAASTFGFISCVDKDNYNVDGELKLPCVGLKSHQSKLIMKVFQQARARSERSLRLI